MLAGGTPRQPLRRRALVRGLARQLVQGGEGGEPALDAVLLFHADASRIVEAADRHRNAVLLDLAVGQRRAAVAAEAPLHGFRALEDARRASRPREVLQPDARERREVIAEGLLAHAAMARNVT